MFAHLGNELRLIQKCGECTSQIHLHGQVCPCRAAELVRHLIGFTVTLGCVSKSMVKTRVGTSVMAIKYNVNRQYIYHWKRRYNGDIQSLANQSHRPHHHLNQHAEAELRKSANFCRKNSIFVLWRFLLNTGITPLPRCVTHH